MPTVFLGLGSNVQPERNLQACAKLLREQFSSIAFSSVYESKAQDEEDQADFLNAVAKIEADLTLDEIHAITTKIEQELGKNPPYPKGPRTIDIDILDTTDRPASSELEIPHPAMHKRRFVLEPLCELSNDPKWAQLLEKTLDQDCTKTDLPL